MSDPFFAALRETPREWLLTERGWIRRMDEDGEPCLCPWLVVRRSQRPSKFTAEAEEIFRAADNMPGHDPALRARLLDACGLKESADA